MLELGVWIFYTWSLDVGIWSFLTCHSSLITFHFCVMERPSIWLMLVILLSAILFLREPRLQRFDEGFLRWLLKNSPTRGGIVPLTVVDVGHGASTQKKQSDDDPRTASGDATQLS